VNATAARPALPIVVLASGRGSNLGALFAAIDAGTCRARVVGVVSDRAHAPALALAADRGVPTAVVPLAHKSERAAWDERLAAAVAAFAPDLAVLAGFMRIVGPAMLRRLPGRIVNVHPSLLPAFPGTDAPAQALAAGVRIAGCTVHVVDEGVDTGPILAQGAVPVLPDDDATRLHARIQRVEHALLPAVIDAIARGEVALGAGAPVLSPSLSARLEHAALMSPWNPPTAAPEAARQARRP
jgi:phosphoribosylglycinamide formyltransferase-1